MRLTRGDDMREPLLAVDGLVTEFFSDSGNIRAVDQVSFTLLRGQTMALLGESGCGKSATALSLMQLIPPASGQLLAGRVVWNGNDLLRMSSARIRQLRGREMAMIFQEPQSALNPIKTIGAQLEEALRNDVRVSRQQIRSELIALLRAVRMSDPELRLNAYPHQLSGGMKQRAMIAMALAGAPQLLIADEPTTALDVTIRRQILNLLADLKSHRQLTLLLITHDLDIAVEFADSIGVMYAGQLVELAERQRFKESPLHPYSQMLFRCRPRAAQRGSELPVIPGHVPSPREWTAIGCRFADRCEFVFERCRQETPGWSDPSPGGRVRCHLYSEKRPHTQAASKPLPLLKRPLAEPVETVLDVRALTVHFPIRRGLFQQSRGVVRAVDGVHLSLRAGKTLALVGESGCGKTTVGKSILQLIRPTAGQVIYRDQDLTTLSGEPLRRLRRDLQIIFQDPFSSLDPRLTVGEIITEGFASQQPSADDRRLRVSELLAKVGMRADAAERYPHEFSGGQRQRINIARALAVNPKILICDEPTSALDLSVQAQLLNLLRSLQQQFRLSLLLITHDLGVVDYLADDVAVMYLGRIVEVGPAEQVLSKPRHPYSELLLAAATQAEINLTPDLATEPPSPVHPPSGCHFHPRCPYAEAVCRTTYPAERHVATHHRVACIR